MRIEKLSPSPDRVGRYTVTFEDGSILRLYRMTLEDHGLYAGKDLSDEAFHQLQQDAGTMSARMRAIRIVSASSVSKSDLERRLVSKGENPEQAAAAVAWMSQMELVDDRKTARQVVDSCIRKGYGLARAKQALYEKRIPKQFWGEALEDYPDQSEEILEFLRSKISDPSDQRQVRKAVDALIRRGHSYGNIRHALSKIHAESEDIPFDEQ